MSTDHRNRVALMRESRNWTQEQLAHESGLSRTEISAIENHRLVPSVSAALSLARAFECGVEELFHLAESEPELTRWATPALAEARFWRAEVERATVIYPAEAIPAGMLAYDGIAHSGSLELTADNDPRETLVIAGCDPAVGLLSHELARNRGVRLLPLSRGSGAGLDLLAEGLVHAAGLHLTDEEGRPANAQAAGALGPGFRLLHLARWQQGLAVSPGMDPSRVGELSRSRISWAVREEGSAARNCLDRLLGETTLPARRRLAVTDHRSTAQAVRNGTAQAGICVRVAAEETRLPFLAMQVENYDLCFRASFESDPRFKALLRTIRSPHFRGLLSQVPGYDTGQTGEIGAA